MARVRLFAALRDLAGASRLEVDAPDVEALVHTLTERFGEEFGRIARAGAVVIDGETADPSRPLDAKDEVALLPPVSGG
jgi:molybdopterin synthase sulfur carrier subunit